MFKIEGRVLEVVPDKQVKGAFGYEPAIEVRVQREVGKDFTDSVMIPDTPANRAGVRAGMDFSAPCIIEGLLSKAGKPWIQARSAYQAAK